MSRRLLMMKPSSMPPELIRWCDEAEASYELTKARNDVRRCQENLTVALDRLEKATEKALLRRRGQ